MYLFKISILVIKIFPQKLLELQFHHSVMHSLLIKLLVSLLGQSLQILILQVLIKGLLWMKFLDEL